MTSAKKSQSHLFTLLLLACTVVSPAAMGAAPANTQTVMLDAELRAQAVDLDNGDLDTSGGDNLGTVALDARLRLTAHLSDNALFFGEGRGVASAGRGSVESADTGALSGGDSFLELRQAYFEFDNLAGAPLSARAGRQKFREPYGVWWNRNFDALRLSYDTTLFAGSIAAGENLFTYRTHGSSLSEKDKDVSRVLAEGSWQYYYENFIEARALYQDDHSDVSVGDIQTPDNFDDGDSNLFWGGIRAAGKAHFPGSDKDKLAYRLDFMGLTGHEHLATTTPSGSSRLVTAVDGRSVRGWGLDAATDIPLPNAWPILHLGYAYGSGDGDTSDSRDHAFRQNGLKGNFSKFGALSENTDNYGTVLRPELSNIHIVSAGLTMPVMEASDIGAVYRYYRLADLATSLMSSGVDDTLTGTSRSLGQGVDFLFNMDVLKEAHLTATNRVQDVKFRSSLGFFKAGKAYGTAEDEVAARGLVEVKVGF
ncbi:MAG: alginate export family protein [Alphaproteobacteria bacterium]